MRSDPQLVWKALPQELSQIDLAQYEMQQWATIVASAGDNQDASAGAKGFIGILGFSLLLATIGTQVFPSISEEHRLTELFEWIDKNDAIDYIL
jgi:hypothetical protein